MKKDIILLTVLCLMGVGALAADEPKRDPAVVRGYIRSCVGEDTLRKISRHEGGAAFLKRFFADTAWMEQFAGSGPWGNSPWKGMDEQTALAGKALEALDLLVWNDKDDFIKSKIGRNIATALALSHGRDWDDEKLVLVMECYREWAKDGTLHEDAWKHDVREWREVLGFGQNDYLSVENLRWIHDFANVPDNRYYGVCWLCHYRLFNCFGASVHGSMYYRPWEHRWTTQELRYRIGGVCGALSKFGSHAAASHGIRSFTAGQPGHCAYLLWDYPTDRWGISYSVTAHTMPHNTLGGDGFAAMEEQDRFYRNPKRMGSEYLRWKGEYAKALKACPGNWSAALSWFVRLRDKKASAAEWEAYAAAVRESFRESPSQGWQLYRPYLEQFDSRDARLAAAKKGLLAMRESKAKTVESPYWDEIALAPLDKLFKDDTAAMWELFEAALEGQAKSPTFYRQTVNWAANRLMTTPESSKKFLAFVGKNAAKTGAELDYRGMILKSADVEDVSMFKQVYSLMDKLSPNLAAKPRGKGWPADQYGGTLLSKDGLLKLSNTSDWDSPIWYRHALDAADFAGGNAFHTGNNKAPWAMVVLPGPSDVTGITVVNSGGAQNGGRQVPLRVWVSEDGKDFKEVYGSDKVQDEWKIALSSPVKAKYIKVGRKPDTEDRIFHLHKILVYGKKLY